MDRHHRRKNRTKRLIVERSRRMSAVIVVSRESTGSPLAAAKTDFQVTFPDNGPFRHVNLFGPRSDRSGEEEEESSARAQYRSSAPGNITSDSVTLAPGNWHSFRIINSRCLFIERAHVDSAHAISHRHRAHCRFSIRFRTTLIQQEYKKNAINYMPFISIRDTFAFFMRGFS